jgi:hypothetical protein
MQPQVGLSTCNAKGKRGPRGAKKKGPEARLRAFDIGPAGLL